MASPAKANGPAIELRSVTLSFGSEPLLKDINLQIASGEVFVLIGPSGQGKSSLIKLMAGLVEPTAGEVIVEGESLRTLRGSARDKLVRKMGVVFQKNALFDSLTVAENVAFPMLETKTLQHKDVEVAVNFYLDAVGIEHARDLYPDEISGGMQKRLGIARALALLPEILFYDDPTAGLDPITSRRIIKLIVDLQKRSKSTVVAVTNDMNRATQMADRIGMVVDHELIICGSPQETMNHPDPRVRQFVRGSLDGPLTVQA